MKIPYVLIPLMSGVVSSCAGLSCRSVVLDDAEVSLLDRYKSFITCVVVTGSEVLSVYVCKDSGACSIEMALCGFCDGSVAVCLCVCWLEALISNRYCFLFSASADGVHGSGLKMSLFLTSFVSTLISCPGCCFIVILLCLSVAVRFSAIPAFIFCGF